VGVWEPHRVRRRVGECLKRRGKIGKNSHRTLIREGRKGDAQAEEYVEARKGKRETWRKEDKYSRKKGEKPHRSETRQPRKFEKQIPNTNPTRKTFTHDKPRKISPTTRQSATFPPNPKKDNQANKCPCIVKRGQKAKKKPKKKREK